ncbi:MAG: tetratricopeptide repeat protein [Haliscomenobacter sp.]|nr:tetratricopeptide repeat protein [Haliscomenobacter sp.]
MNFLFLDPCTHCIQGSAERGYGYSIDAYEGMFHLKYQQKRVDEAFEWLEKAFQQAAKEDGNETSSEFFDQAIFRCLPQSRPIPLQSPQSQILPETEKK